MDMDTVSGSYDGNKFNGAGGVYFASAEEAYSSTGPDYVGENITSGFSVSVPFQFSTLDGGSGDILLQGYGTGYFRITMNGYSWTGASGITANINDDDGNSLIEYTGNRHDDGNPHHLIVNCYGINSGDIEFFVDDMSNPEPNYNNRDEGLSSSKIGEFTSSTYVMDNTDYGASGTVGNIRWFSETLSESQRTTVDDSLPW